jgi:hypothetical protein
MPDDPTNDQSGHNQNNALEGNWYDNFVGDNTELAESLSKYETFDDYNKAFSEAANRDWRAEIAGDDEKFRSTLDRFESPGAFGNSFREAQQKIRSGQLKADMPEDATEEQIKEYRRANNIPLEADGYLKDLPEGLVIGEEDKDIVAGFVEQLHNKNASPEIVHEALRWYNEFAENTQAQMSEIDSQHRQEAINELQGEWSGDYTTNMNLINGMLRAELSEEDREALTNGRYGDGRGFFNSPGVLKLFGKLARMYNPHGKPLPNDVTALQATEDEITEIEALMGDRSSKYYKGPEAEKLQARIRELYEIRSRAQENAA